jgi:cell division protease FtsH
LEVFYDESSDDSGRFKTYSELTKEVIDTESMKLINNAYKEAKMLIQDNKELFDDITNKLIKEKTLLGKDILLMI